MTAILVNVIVIALLAGAYYAWQTLQGQPSKRWPKLAERLGLKYEGPPPRLTGPWKNRQVTIQLDGERASASFPVRKPEGLRLEIGPREEVEKAAGIVVPDRVDFNDPSSLAFNQRYMVRCKPQALAASVLDPVMRQRIMAIEGFHVLAEAGRLTVPVDPGADSDGIQVVLDLAASLLDGLEA
ncbi:MAG: hypothetical protein HY924_04245 [Elusimicrobia bacterium]|nr:hypothetical protein [Elusimicrobiota bacterium]